MAVYYMEGIGFQQTNNDLNNSGDSLQRYSDWKGYRDNLTKFIEKNIGNKEFNSVIVLGAGKCNDIDLNFLTTHFNRVVLTDIDRKSLEEGIDRQNLTSEKKDKIERKQVDYLNLDNDQFLSKLFKMVTKNKGQQEINKFIKDSIDKIKVPLGISKYKNKFDVVITSTVYTQLFYNNIKILLDVVKKNKPIYPSKNLQDIDMQALESMNIVIKKYNDLLVYLLKDKGTLISWTDLLEYDQNFKNVIEEYLEDTEKLEMLVLSKGLLAGRSGREDLVKRLQIIDSKWLLWQFNNDRGYLVNIIVGKAKI